MNYVKMAPRGAGSRVHFLLGPVGGILPKFPISRSNVGGQHGSHI